MRRFALTHDYLCPFARNAAEVVVRALEARAPVEPAYRAFSLSQVHLEDGEAPVWQPGAEPRSGVLALQWGLAVRDELPERFGAVHLALFAARHDQGLDLNDPGVLAEAVASAG
ncbi:MAG TPA: protein-disulfide isomerase, partial [Actinomycetota bacterium]|nr:protein-disulfide isomerase [Actinomycetota bacterium]